MDLLISKIEKLGGNRYRYRYKVGLNPTKYIVDYIRGIFNLKDFSKSEVFVIVSNDINDSNKYIATFEEYETINNTFNIEDTFFKGKYLEEDLMIAIIKFIQGNYKIIIDTSEHIYNKIIKEIETNEMITTTNLSLKLYTPMHDRSINIKKRKNFSCYLDANLYAYCKKIFQLINFHINEATVVIHSKETKPDDIKKIKTLSEFNKISKDNEIDGCIFDGKYGKEDISITIDYRFSVLEIVASKETIKKILNKLELQSIRLAPEQIILFEFCGKDYKVKVFTDTFPNETITQNQQETYDMFHGYKKSILCQTMEHLNKIIADNLPEGDIKSYKLSSFFVPKAIYISNEVNQRVLGIFFKSRFDRENDLVLKVVNEKIVEVGTQDIIL